MNAVGMWNRLRAAPGEGGTAHDESLRRVAVRMAVQTVGLLLVMLLVLEIVVYFITQRALMNTIEKTLQDRAHADPGLVRAVYGPPGFPGGGPGHLHSPHDDHPSDASVTFLNLNLHPVGGGEGNEANEVYDPAAARSALRSNQNVCCTTVTHHGQTYRVYSALATDQGLTLGVIQSSISLDQYQSTLDNLRGSLVIVAILGLLISAGISAVLVRRALEPVRVAMQRQRDFVADAAHELRTPLAIMRSSGELGMAEESSEDRQATIEQMLAQTSHLTRLVDDLSLLARADSNAVMMQQSRVDLASLVSGLTEEIQPLAEEQGVALVTRTGGEIAVFGDIIRLRQLLLILLDNALKHTPSGGNVRVSLDQRGGRADLRVADSGPGIDPADLPHIFDRFYRVDKARTGEGTGLGLAIARWIVEAHGGAIQAGNEPGGGAVFTVTLPILRTSAAPDARPAPQSAS